MRMRWRRTEIKQKRQCQMIVHDIEYRRGSLAVNSTIHICTKVNCEMTIMRQNEDGKKSTKRWSLSQLDCLTACMRRWMSDMRRMKEVKNLKWPSQHNRSHVIWGLPMARWAWELYFWFGIAFCLSAVLCHSTTIVMMHKSLIVQYYVGSDTWSLLIRALFLPQKICQ